MTVGADELAARLFPLVNDVSHDGALLTITGVDQPPARAGTLVVDGQSLLYNRDPSWGGEFSVAYRALSATGAAGESTATFTVLPPVESELTFPSEPPAPIGGVLDANPSTFASVYAAAVGGQHLRLANGDYGDLLLTKTFPADRPLVIRAANKHRARLTGFVRPNGLGHWLHELELDRAPSGVITGDSDSDRARRLAQYQVQVVAVGNRYLWLTRNSVRSELGLRVGNGTKYIWVGWNRFDGESSQGYGAHIDIAQEPFTDPAAAVRDVLLYRNDFRDGSRRWTESGAAVENFHVLVHQAYEAGASGVRSLQNVVIAHNRVKGSYRSRPFWAMLGCRIENNYLDRAAGLTNPAGGAVIGFRHGRGGRLWGNRCADAVDVAVNDGSAAEPHDIRANITAGALRLYAGARTAAGAMFQAANSAIVVGNTITSLVAGYLPPGATLDEGMGGAVDSLRLHSNSALATHDQVDWPSCIEDQGSDGGFAIPPTIQPLGDDDVGPGADAPVARISPVADTLRMNVADTTRDFDVLGNDRGPGELMVLEAKPLPGPGPNGSGECTIEVIRGGAAGGNNIRISRNGQVVSTVHFIYTMGLADGSFMHPTPVDITVEITRATIVAGAYDWGYAFPAKDAVTVANCHLWTPGQAFPVHDPADIVIAQGPAAPLTGEMYGQGSLKGWLVLIGLDLRPKGVWRGTGHTEANPFLGVRAIWRVTFAANSASHGTWQDEPGGPSRNWPGIFIANCRVSYQDNSCAFGDFLRIGHAGARPNSPPPASIFNGGKGAVFLNRVRMERGPHYASNTLEPTLPESENGHSDLVQSFGGIPIYRAADCYLDWPAGQAFFSGREAADVGWPRTTRWRFKNVALRHSTKWLAHAPNHVLLTNPQFIKATEEPPGGQTGDNKVEWHIHEEGKYMAVRFDTRCFVQGRFPIADTANVLRYVRAPGGMTGIGQTTRLYQFSTAVKGNHTFPAYSGELEYLPPTGTLPETCDPSHVGTDLRITSVQQFLNILNP